MTRARWFVGVACMVALAGCGGGQAMIPVGQAGENLGTFTIYENTQGQCEKLRIGVANIWEREYTENSQPKKGLTAVLAISYQGDPSKSGNHVVYPGKTVILAEYRIVVNEVKEDTAKHSSWVVIEIFR